jgi:hypothetical protein
VLGRKQLAAPSIKDFPMSESMFQLDGMPSPGSTVTDRVQSLNALTPAEDATATEKPEYYYCPSLNISMYRKDGFRLIFLHRIHETRLAATIKYLDNEISLGHPHLRKATPAEIATYKAIMELSGEIEAQMRAKYEAEIKKQLASKGIDPDLIKLQGTSSVEEVEAMMKDAVKVDGATIIPTHSPQEQMQRAIVGSDKIRPAAAAGSLTGKVG